MENPPVRHNSASKCRNAAKVRGARKGRHESTEKIPRARRVCGRPRGQTRLRARTPRRAASAAAGSSEPPRRAARYPERGDPGRRAAGDASPHFARHNLPRISCPWWTLQASLYSQLPNSWWLFQQSASALHQRYIQKVFRPRRVPPAVGGCLGSQVKVS